MKILDTQVSVSIIPQASKQASNNLTFKVTIRKFIYKSSLIIRCGLSAADRAFFILRVLCLSVFNLIDMVCYGGMSTAVKADLTGNTIYK